MKYAVAVVILNKIKNALHNVIWLLEKIVFFNKNNISDITLYGPIIHPTVTDKEFIIENLP